MEIKQQGTTKRVLRRTQSLLLLKSWEALEDYINAQEVIDEANNIKKKLRNSDPLLDDFMVLLNRSGAGIQYDVTFGSSNYY